jgi:ABC-type lipoprotein export system ATPase subunit
MIHAVGISKVYTQGSSAAIAAVAGVSLEVQKGESVLITGPSGAGKSTLLHLLGGLDRPTEGTLFFNGIDFYRLSDRERSRIRNEKIGFIFQMYHLLPEFTVMENVMLPALMRRRRAGERTSHIRKHVKALLEIVGLEKRADHRPSELSGGESQRTAIARALVNDPEVLLCDEPIGNLDSKKGEEIIECLWALKEKKGTALVIVTHDEEIHDGFDRRYMIKDGILGEISKYEYHPPEADPPRAEDSKKISHFKIQNTV